jgi:hypothetical protein
MNAAQAVPICDTPPNTVSRLIGYYPCRTVYLSTGQNMCIALKEERRLLDLGRPEYRILHAAHFEGAFSRPP